MSDLSDKLVNAAAEALCPSTPALAKDDGRATVVAVLRVLADDEREAEYASYQRYLGLAREIEEAGNE